MTMDVTVRWALPLLYAGQAQKELFHNEALTVIDALLHGRAESADISVPPASPLIGQCWIVAAGATDAWADQTGRVACWSEGGWRFFAPQNGLSLFVADREHRMIHDGSVWRDGSLRADGLHIAGHQVVGGQMAAISAPAGGATVDDNARSAINAILGALRAHGLIAS